jgi:hypothetical protein
LPHGAIDECDERRKQARSLAHLPVVDVQIENPGVVDQVVERAAQLTISFAIETLDEVRQLRARQHDRPEVEDPLVTHSAVRHP